MIALLLWAALAVPPGDPPASLHRARALFAAGRMSDAQAVLRVVAEREPGSAAGARAAAWLGDLALGRGDLGEAQRRYAAAARGPGDAGALGSRGAGDVAVRKGHFAEALRHYQAGLRGASPQLAVELEHKHALAARWQRRGRIEAGAWAAFGAALLFFAVRAARGRGPWGAPAEALYAAPVYGVLCAAALGQERAAQLGLALGAAGSLLLMTASGLAVRRRPPGPAGRWAHAGALLLGNAGLAFGIVCRAGLIDRLFPRLPL